jgi:hypothetical protein
MKLTVGWLDSRKEPRNRPKVRQEKTVDGHAGPVWVYPSGEVVFVFRYTPPGSPNGARRKMRLGQYGGRRHHSRRSLRSPLTGATRTRKKLDPIEERERRATEAQKARDARSAAGTVSDLADQFVHRKLRPERWDAERNACVRDSKAKTKPWKRPDEAAALLKSNLVDATLDGIKGYDLTRRQMVRILEAIVDRGSPVTAKPSACPAKAAFRVGCSLRTSSLLHPWPA